jgi:hyperosmotically inducible protein
MQKRLAILISTGSLAFTMACSQSDTGITTAVKSRMAADDTVKASEINVDTHNHVVTLNGTVASNAEKERAVAIARDTNGVTSVVDDLVIGVPAATSGRDYDDRAEDSARDAKDNAEDTARDAKDDADDYARDAKNKSAAAADKTGDVITDAAITSAVKSQFLAEPGVSGLNINVDTSDGVVTLTGNVKTRAEADKAMSIARESKGVKRVVSHLKVAA